MLICIQIFYALSSLGVIINYQRSSQILGVHFLEYSPPTRACFETKLPLKFDGITH